MLRGEVSGGLHLTLRRLAVPIPVGYSRSVVAVLTPRRRAFLGQSRRTPLLATDIGRVFEIGDRAAADAAEDFFRQCHHLKDWLKKDTRVDLISASLGSPSLNGISSGSTSTGLWYASRP